MKAAAFVAAVSLAAAAAFASGGGQGGGLLTAYDRSGNGVVVSNRFDGSGYSVALSHLNRRRGIDWERLHADGYQESANAVSIDGAGDIYVAGVRWWDNAKVFWVVKYSAVGDLLWERTDGAQNCAALVSATNDNGDLWLSGSCLTSGGRPVHTVLFDQYGNYRWGQFYDEGGRQYVRGLSLDVADRASVTMEFNQTGYNGSYIRTVVYDPAGGRLAVY